MGTAVNVVIHAVTVLTVVSTCTVTVRYIRRSRQALAELIDIFRGALDAGVAERERDRADLRQLIRDVEIGVAGVHRLEAAGVLVADDLASAHRRADETAITAPAGTAADAASRQTEAEAGRA